ncbi:PPK2 family polyphosphate kinase [Taibaiella koreensis]|uniref:PPK2 family polyphosphate kinase n=1 Tax=Taibaiella koreensis TaxID=1268548 RepID=UPI000E59FC9F|nr:PPK2 family polyphosphate kinase [Taibaiella koreensis]
MAKAKAAYRLDKISTRAPKGLDKDATKGKTLALLQELDELQNLLYAESRHSLLVVVQGMDASGKDGLVRDVFSSMNPQGVRVASFKVPTAEEASHDFLWRIHRQTPEKGMIQLFNRSHYEDVLVTRVHGWCDDKTAAKRMRAINDFERLLEENNTHILKVYLHVSHEEQRARLEERLSIPRKMWKYNKSDLIESNNWDRYRKYYEEVFSACNEVPWHIIPADQNWYKSHLVAQLLKDTLSGLKMKYPGLKK